MKNTIEKGKVHILILGARDKYIGLCKEFGFIEEGNNLEEIESRLKNSIILLLETVRKHPEHEMALNLGLPFKYKLLFYIVPFFVWISTAVNRFDTNIRYFTSDISSLRHAKILPQS